MATMNLANIKRYSAAERRAYNSRYDGIHWKDPAVLKPVTRNPAPTEIDDAPLKEWSDEYLYQALINSRATWDTIDGDCIEGADRLHRNERAMAAYADEMTARHINIPASDKGARVNGPGSF